jgi:hypothetical protein
VPGELERNSFAARQRRLPAFLAFLGTAFVVGSAIGLLTPRAHPVAFMPAAGTTVGTPGASAAVRFDRQLHGSSFARLSRIRVASGMRSGERVALTLRGNEIAAPWPREWGDGFYEVRWTARIPGAHALPLGSEGVYRFEVREGRVASPMIWKWDEGALDPRRGSGDRRWMFLAAGLILIGVGLRQARLRPGG